MDYGPAIACAFASQEGAEAVRLRNVILECMKSSPRDVYTRQCYEQAHAEAEYIQENRKPYDDSYGTLTSCVLIYLKYTSVLYRSFSLFVLPPDSLLI